MLFDQKEHLKRISNMVEKDCKCLICNKSFLRYNLLTLHVINEHKLTAKEYFDKYLLKDKSNICYCGNVNKFKSIKHGYKKYCSVSCASKGKHNPNYGKRYPGGAQTKEGRKRISTAAKKNKNWLKAKGKLSQKGRKAISKRSKIWIKELNSRGFENRGGRCKFFKVNDLLLQGRYELCFYLKNYKKITLTKHKPIKTPYGFYTPDFEYKKENQFLEIKSTYTIKNCLKGKQYNKIKWVRKNVKFVRIIILSEKEVKKYLSEIDFKKYIYKT